MTASPGIRNLPSGRSDISGGRSGRFSGASDGSGLNAVAGAISNPVKPSKLNDIAGNTVLSVGWHECCLMICQKKRQL
ncbi:bsr3718 [Bradyrhizobium diazoefficiens USDA 110]|uniref:Bsr3718 protein n=1 Tax=Bradyrhizobium diazoefficiens (strain JCM 10833 / BCRC 13528 / IAM 13628 / NBRC 14792 / USDA 110) TaxID=224911 RepID=Q89NW5_BRADU|nr:hypothetical protein CO678_18380 [Bradyrhizobium diazoefficiens]QBP27134.1 hypothetical protein Bdiaspc4_19185 [Bradyrhizobium diazoefficiens]BAC48983.1 bsr3718 [Bradyrhizobium diazoefficiens USDA 110]